MDMTKVRFQGRWSDPAERDGIRTALAAVIPEGQAWTVGHPKGDEPVLTYNPSQPLEPMRGRPLQKLRASAMRNPPRYLYWNNAADDLCFTASTLIEMVLMVGIYNEVGAERIRREMSLFESLPE
jgi:hypothetical protein